MNRQEFIQGIASQVRLYIDNFYRFDGNAQIRVNPTTKHTELVNGRDLYDDIEDSDEVVENAAIAGGLETETADDFQASENPDFYPVGSLTKKVSETEAEPDMKAIDKLADKYFAE